MTIIDGQPISHRLPFLHSGTVIYVAGTDSAVQDDFVADNVEIIQARFDDAGYRFIFLPELLESISDPVQDYLFPLQETPDVSDVYAHIRETAGIGDRAGLIYKYHSSVYFRMLPDSDPDDLQKEIDDLAERLEEASQIRFRKTGAAPPRFKKSSASTLQEREILFDASESLFGDDLEEIAYSLKEPLDERTEAILAEIDRIVSTYGISVEDLRVMLGYRVKLSHLKVFKSGRILLADFGKEVKMNPLSKALYFLYLRHPEGIRFKEVVDHREELLDIYMGITGRDDPEEIEKTIDVLIDPLGDGLNVCASRIKAAFRDKVGDIVARFYYLEGGAGKAKKVPLDRDFVIWEY